MSCEQCVGNPLCSLCIVVDGCCDWGCFEAKTSSESPEDTTKNPGQSDYAPVTTTSAIQTPGLYMALRAPLGVGIDRG